MTRHSKNNNALGIFTQNEVAKMGIRSVSQRLGGDSMQCAFDLTQRSTAAICVWHPSKHPLNSTADCTAKYA